MNIQIPKKYAKAILSCESKDSLNELVISLKKLSTYFKNHEFKNIILMPSIKPQKKINFIFSLIDNSDSMTKNLITMLANNNRLEIIPSLYKEITSQLAISDNKYIANVFTEQELSKDELAQLSKSFSGYFNADITLEKVDKKYNGAKVELNELGIEVSFSIDKFKTQLSEHILKAI